MEIQKRYFKKFNGSAFVDVPITSIEKGDTFKIYDHVLEHKWNKLKNVLNKYKDIEVAFNEVKDLDKIIALCEASAEFRKLNERKKVMWTAVDVPILSKEIRRYVEDNIESIENPAYIQDEYYLVKAYNSIEGKDNILKIHEVIVS